MQISSVISKHSITPNLLYRLKTTFLSCTNFIFLKEIYTTQRYFYYLCEILNFRLSQIVEDNLQYLCVNRGSYVALKAGYATSPPSGMLSKGSEEH